jgi:hypothetical protein
MAQNFEAGSYYFTSPKTGNRNWVTVSFPSSTFFPNANPNQDVGIFEFEDERGVFYVVSRRDFMSQTSTGAPRFESEGEKQERERQEAEEKKGAAR